LLGITFDRDSWMYLARGNVGSEAWAIRGKDGTVISGLGDGGNVIRGRPDATQAIGDGDRFLESLQLEIQHAR